MCPPRARARPQSPEQPSGASVVRTRMSVCRGLHQNALESVGSNLFQSLFAYNDKDIVTLAARYIHTQLDSIVLPSVVSSLS
jgi:hypothetical protein